MRRLMAILAALAFVAAASVPAQARRHHRSFVPHSLTCVHNTIKTETAYGIDICVDPRYASKFQAFFYSLKASGARVTNIVCQAYGHAPGSNHIGGGACDVNQRAKNRTIPAMYHAGAMIREAGLYDGCSFRDCGHVEAMRGLGNYGGRTFAARSHRRKVQIAITGVSNNYMNRPQVF